MKKRTIISSFIWKLNERFLTQGLQFVIQIILARLLIPDDYGVLALVVIFTSVATVFVQSGFNTALIQKKNADKVDFSSVFYLSLGVSLVLYILVYFLSPVISRFYGLPEITPVLRVLSVGLLFGAVNSIQNAYVVRNLQFKILFVSSTVALICSGTIGIYLAYEGFGVWALVWQQLSNQLLVTLFMWFTVKWRPRCLMSLARLKSLFSYGWKLLVSSLLNTIEVELRSLIIGRLYDPYALGIYSRGKQFPSVIVTNIDGAIQTVMLPVLSFHQDNKDQAKKMMRRAITSSSFLIFPLMVGLAVTAKPIVQIVLTDKWLPSVPFLQIYCFSYALRPIHSANLQAINALGRSDIFLRLEIVKKLVGFIVLAVTLFYGIHAIALGGALSGLLSSFINAYPNKHLLDYSYSEQIKDLMPSLILSLFMGLVVYSLNWAGLSVYLTLFLQVTLGIVLYIGLARLTKMESYTYLKETLKTFAMGSDKEGKHK